MKIMIDRFLRIELRRVRGFIFNLTLIEENFVVFFLLFWKFNNLFTGATFGTGITAIKLTALGRPKLLVSTFLFLIPYNFFSTIK